MPGDPLRAKFIAETFIEYSECVNDVRGINGYTGFYKGKRVSRYGQRYGYAVDGNILIRAFQVLWGGKYNTDRLCWGNIA